MHFSRWILGIAFATAACSDDRGLSLAPIDSGVVTDAPRVVTDTVFRDVVRDTGTDVPRNLNPIVVGVVPEHGPFNGGTEVVVRGSNFDEGASVTFGGSLVQPRDTRFTDSHRLTVLSPAGRPGPADVVVELNGMRTTLPMGFTYDSIYADPNIGGIAGNTSIAVNGLGTHFTDLTTVTLDGLPCTNITVDSPERLHCNTPQHPEGHVTLEVTTGSERITVREGYEYSDGSDAIRGGLGGGAINGAINVTVIAAGTGDALPNAYVWVGNDPTVAAPRSTRTNTQGRATISYPGLTGPVTLTASARCFSSHTVQVFDARNVTVYLYPQMIPACAMGDPPPPGSSSGTFGTQIRGELVWDGPREFAPNPWQNVPEPRMGERRVAFVYTTQPDILYPTVSPGDGNTVLEVVNPGYGGRGYPFSILGRPASLAVYAIAGIEVIRTQRFTPYIMGVARGVLGSPRAVISNVIVPMNIPLDHATEVQVHTLPDQVASQPSRVRVEGFIDLGGEGVMARPDITAYGVDEADTYRLVALPAFIGPLADARLTVRGIYGSNDTFNAPPLSALVVAGITTPDDTVHLRNWVGIPDITTPTDTGRLGSDRTIRFNLNSGEPDMYWVTLAADVIYWSTWTRGSERSFVFPDISSVMGLSDLPQGSPMYMSISAIRVPSFNFNEFRTTYLSQLYWTAYSNRSLNFSR